MLDSAIALSLYIAAIGAGLMAGVYFAFSAFIMRSFDRLGAIAAADAMNAINDVILRSGFMILFWVSTGLYAALVPVALFDDSIAGRGWLMAAGLLYVIGMFVCTAAFNVPLNNRLAATADDDIAKQEAWPHYLQYWTRWNSLRTVCSLASCAISITWLTAHS